MKRKSQAIIVALSILAGSIAGYKISPYLPRFEFVEKYILPGYNPQDIYGKTANSFAGGLISGGLAAIIIQYFSNPLIQERRLTREEEELRLLGLDDRKSN